MKKEHVKLSQEHRTYLESLLKKGSVPAKTYKRALALLELDPDRCIVFNDVECGICARVCPVGDAAIALDDRGRPVIRAEGCVGCGVCVRACVTTPSSLSLHLE